MRISVLLLTLSLVPLSAAADWTRPGKPAPDFAVRDVDGKPVSLEALRGKYVWSVTASWRTT